MPRLQPIDPSLKGRKFQKKKRKAAAAGLGVARKISLGWASETIKTKVDDVFSLNL